MVRKSPASVRSAEIPAEELDRQFKQIHQAILQKPEFIENLINQRFPSPKPWRFLSADFVLSESGETIDLVFVHSDPEDVRFVLVDMAIPYLGRGRKYTLEAKSKRFVQQQGVTAARVKKGILLIKRSSQAVTTFSARIHCPIMDVSVEDLIPELAQTPVSAVSTKAATPTPPISAAKPQIAVPPQAPVAPPPVEVPPPPIQQVSRIATPVRPPVTPAPSAPVPGTLSPQILDDLKNTIVQECLSTLHKRRNKYIRKGLWKWIEREIVDPNTHFFLVILSCIYQGEVGEVLSRRFKICDDYCKTPEAISDAIFSRDAGVAGEIMKNSERHRRALKKFLECFSSTPPFDYLRSLFLKEFRTVHDSIKSRVSVFDTLKELMARCGFEGEKEIQYPLEILDELGIFQGFIMGNFTELRVDNAGKKLRQLVPGLDWTPTEIYRLRDQLATRLDLSPAEFNLNAFLPQKFISSRKDAATILQPQSRGPRERPQPQPPRHQPVQHPAPFPQGTIDQDAPPTSFNEPSAPVPARTPGGSQGQSGSIPAQTDPMPSMPQRPLPPRNGPSMQPRPRGPAQSPSAPPPPPRPPAPAFAPAPPRPPADPNAMAILSGQPRRTFGPEDLEESKHRNFDQFGGHTQIDPEMTKFGLDYGRAILREQKSLETSSDSNMPGNRAPAPPVEEPEIEEATPSRRTIEMRENRMPRAPIRNQKRGRRRPGGGSGQGSGGSTGDNSGNRPRPGNRPGPYDGNRR